MATIKRLVVTRADGTTFTVTPNLGDTLNFESTLRKNPRWGTLQENVLKMQPFRAWSAGRRTGAVTESWEDFSSGENAVLDVSFEDAEDAGDDDELAVDGVGLDTPTVPASIY